MASTSTNLNPTNSGTSAPALYAHDGAQRHRYDDDEVDHWNRMKTMMRRERAAMRIPPGWRFRPTDQELIIFYLMNKLLNRPLPENRRIVHVHLYKYSPMELAARCQLAEDPEMFFFTPREKKYPRGSRPSRTAGNGFWKATGLEKQVIQNGRIIGYKSALVFYIGKQQTKGKKTNWIMQEYVITKKPKARKSARALLPHNKTLDEWVLCKIYENTKGKNKKIGKIIPKEEAGSADEGGDEVNSSALMSIAQHGHLRNPLPPPSNNIPGVRSDFSYFGDQYNMINGSVTQFGSSTNFGTTHYGVTNFGSTTTSYAKQEMIPNTEGGHHGIFDGTTPYGQSTVRFCFEAQSVAMYNNNNGSQLDDINGHDNINGHGMFPVYSLENQYFSDDPLPDFGYLDDIGEDLPFGGVPIDQNAGQLDPAPRNVDPVTQSTSTKTDDH